MERRVLLAIFLAFLVLYVYQALVVKYGPKPPQPAATTATAHGPQPAQPAAAQASPGTTAASPAKPETPSKPETAVATPTPVLGATSEREVTLENADLTAVFTNRGARLKSWRLKHYHDAAGQPQELVEQSSGQPLPFTLQTPDEQLTERVNTALFAVEGAGRDWRFEYRDSAGTDVVKTFHLDAMSYVLTAGTTVTSQGAAVPVTVAWGPAMGDVGELTRGMQGAGGLVFAGGKVQRLSTGDIGKQPTHEGDFQYAGVDDNYFMAVALSPGPATVTYRSVSIPPPPDTKGSARTLVAFSIAPQRAGPLKFFVGPKDFDLLTAMDHDLASAVNFGRFAFIVVPLLRSLKWINGYVGNWGWSIVILTVIINLLIAPLRHKQVVSMRKMQEIQPEVKAIQDRYAKVKATDPAKQKMNQEMMALYREKKVNPAAGCVPMILTLPLVYAMWAMLETSIELRGAPWVFWIHDLSARDPYYILPGLMVGTQLWQSLIMPSAGADPAQQRMMQIVMPIVLGFIFLFLPAGALLYYVVGTLFGVGQQYLTNYYIGPPVKRTIRPAAERRLKKKDD